MPPAKRSRPLNQQVIRHTLELQKKHPKATTLDNNGRVSLEGRAKLNERIIRTVISEPVITQHLLDPQLSDEERIRKIVLHSLEKNSHDPVKAAHYLQEQYDRTQAGNYDNSPALIRLGRMKKMNDPKKYASETGHATVTGLTLAATQLFAAIKQVRRMK